MAAHAPNWPDVESPFLSELLVAFKCRSKAIKYSLGEWRIEGAKDGDFERLDFDFFTLGRLRHDVRLTAWENQVLWLRSCQPAEGRNAGWRYAFAFHLDATAHSPAAVVETYEKSRIWLHDEEETLDSWRAFSPTKDTSV